jgi:hypothetical protein
MRLAAAACLLSLVLALDAAAGDGRTYAVLSLVGDQLLITQPGSIGGSRAHRNFVALESAALDREAVFAVEDALKRADKDARVVLLGARSPALFEAQRKVLDADGSTTSFLPAIKDVVAGAGATHLILVSKHRGEARLRVANGLVGNGTLEGLGFYLDSSSRMRNTRTGETSQGYIAPFAYMRMSLIDLAGGQVLREETVLASTTVSSQQADASWQVLTSEEKARILRGVMRREIDRVLPALIGP